MAMMIDSIYYVTVVEKTQLNSTVIFRRISLVDRQEHRTKMIDHFEYLHPMYVKDNNGHEQCLPTIYNHHLFDLFKHIYRTNNDNDHVRYITIHGGYE
jgi:hypothetical protein